MEEKTKVLYLRCNICCAWFEHSGVCHLKMIIWHKVQAERCNLCYHQTTGMLMPSTELTSTQNNYTWSFNKAIAEHVQLCMHQHIYETFSPYEKDGDKVIKHERLECLRSSGKNLSHDWAMNCGGTFIQLCNPGPFSHYRINNETTFWNDPPRWPWAAHRFPLNLYSLPIASKPSQQLLHATSKCHVGAWHLISPLWCMEGRLGNRGRKKMKDRRECVCVCGGAEKVWILNA